MSTCGWAEGGGGNTGSEPRDDGLNVEEGLVVKLEEDDEGFGPYFEEWMSSGVDWLKLLNGGELPLRAPPARGGYLFWEVLLFVRTWRRVSWSVCSRALERLLVEFARAGRVDGGFRFSMWFLPLPG